MDLLEKGLQGLGNDDASDIELKGQIKKALELVTAMLKLFAPEELAITFNGGKDACVVFHLVRMALAQIAKEGGGDSSDDAIAQTIRRLKMLYFEPKKEFPEVIEFMAETAQRYGFEYTVYTSSYKEGMGDLVEGRGVKAVFMGVRRGDPFTEDSEHMQPSSSGWPAFLRVYPILRWDYGHVWRFMRHLGLPYCVLYDRGYTSIGDFDTTVPNAALERRRPDGSVEYLPAHQLTDYSLERANRKTGHGSGLESRKRPRDSITSALVCVGDFLDPSCSMHAGPITLAHILRGGGCKLSPVMVLPVQEDLLTLSIASHCTSACCHTEYSMVHALFVLCIDEATESMVSRVIAGVLASDPTCTSLLACSDASEMRPPPPPSHEGSSAAVSSLPPPAPAAADDGALGEVRWECCTKHTKRFRRVVLIGQSFLGLSNGQQQQEMENVLKAVEVAGATLPDSCASRVQK